MSRPVAAPARLVHADVGVAASGAVVLLLLATFVVWPLARLLWVSVEGPAGLTLGNYQAFFGSWRLARVLVNSLVVAAVSTALTVVVALVLAYAVTRTTIAGRRFVSLMAVLPLISPPFLAALAFILLLGRNGLVTRGLGLDWSIEGFTGIVAAQVFTFLPQAYIVLASVLAAADVALEEAAESLGAGPLTTLRRVTLVAARPGLASAALLVFVLCVADFGNPILVGGRYHVLTTEIYSQVSGMKDVASASTMSVILIGPCLLAWVASTAGAGLRASVTLAAGACASLRPTPAALRWPLTLLAGGIALLVAVVYGLIPLGSLVRLWGSDWSLSLRHYAVASTAAGAWPIWNSLRLAAAAGVLGTVLALVTAYVVERKHPPGSRLLASLSRLPAALPGTVVGVGYVLAFNAPPLLLTGTVWILLASVVFWKLPVAVRAAVSALEEIDPAVEEAAISLGAGSVRTLVRVVLPLLTSTACSIFLYFFVNGMVTVSAVIFLVFPGFDLASAAILGQVAHGDPGVACALGTLVLAIVVAAILLLRGLLGERVAILEL